MAIEGTGLRVSEFNPEWLLDVLAQKEEELLTTYTESNEWQSVDYNSLSDPKVAYEILNQARDAFRLVVEVNLSMHSSLAWLFLLRECPDVLFGGSPGTPATSLNLRELAERSTATAPPRRRSEDEPKLPPRDFRVRVSPPGLTALLEVIAATRIVGRLLALARMAAKGVRFAGTPDFPPLPQPTSPQRNAIARYDRRLNTELELIWRPSTLRPEKTRKTGPPDLDILKVGRLPRRREQAGDGPHADPLQYFEVGVTNLSDLFGFNTRAQSHGFGPWYSRTAVPCFLLLSMALEMVNATPPSVEALRQKGAFIFTNEALLMETLARYFDDALGAARCVFPGAAMPREVRSLHDELKDVQGSLWPPRPGAFFRQHGETVGVDLCAVTNAFNVATRMPLISGAFANHRSSLFEYAVQSAIDDSIWAPDAGLRAMRGRRLLKHGRAITDVDAIGAHEGTLLLVDCLDNVRDEEAAFTGDYKAYRNMASRLEDKVGGDVAGRGGGWLQKITVLPGQRGDNWDFSTYNNVIPLVVTASAVYVEEALVRRPVCVSALEIHPGLALAPTLAELRRWLQDPRRARI